VEYDHRHDHDPSVPHDHGDGVLHTHATPHADDEA
jgi:hypothetical protein